VWWQSSQRTASRECARFAADVVDHDAGHMVTCVSELDEEAAPRVVAELAANGRP
jgi:hypothetical protein